MCACAGEFIDEEAQMSFAPACSFVSNLLEENVCQLAEGNPVECHSVIDIICVAVMVELKTVDDVIQKRLIKPSLLDLNMEDVCQQFVVEMFGNKFKQRTNRI